MSELKVLMERKSVRAYSEKEVTRETKDKIIEATLRAATAGNMMLYSVIEVDDQDLKDKLAKSCDDQPMISKAPFVLIFVADFQRWMDYLKASDVEKYNKINNLEMYKPDEGLLVKCINDAMIAAQTSVTAADMLGLGSCYIGDILEHFEYHKELLGLPKYTFACTLVCYGYPTEQQKERPLTKRYPKEFVVHKNKYRHVTPEEFKKMDKEYYSDNKNQWLQGCENAAQHFYKRKLLSDFMKELCSSVKRGIKSWAE